MSNNKKYQIFISSTYEDLKDERDAVVKAILKMKHFPIGMEMFNAGNDEQWKIITDTIDNSDYYVLILGQRYGSTLKRGCDPDMSYTEREYHYAESKGIPVIAFIIDDKVKINKEDIEDQSKRDRLEQFKNNVKDHHMVEWFKSPEDLAVKVTNALFQEFDQDKRPGWSRSDNDDAEEISHELVVLNKENRELKEEIDKLKKQIETRETDLSIGLNIGSMDKDNEDDKKNKQLFKTPPKIFVNGTGLDIKIKTVKQIDLFDDYMPINYDDKAKRLNVSQEEIDYYNSALPSKEMVEKYCEEIQHYNDLIQNGAVFSVIINNNGSLKATDVRVTIEAPDEIYFYELYSAEKWTTPEKPKKAQNPIEQAEIRKLCGTFGETTDALSSILHPNYGLGINKDLKFLTKPYSPRTANNNIKKVSPHKIEIYSNQILNFEKKELSRFYMFSNKPGNYKLRCKIICTELPKAKEQEIAVNIINE